MRDKTHMPKLPKETQKTASWYVRLWPRYVLKREEILLSSNTSSLMETPAGSGQAKDGVLFKVIKLEDINKVLDVIESAKKSLPDEYRQGVWNNAIFSLPYPSYADIKTWKAYRNDFLYEVAVGLNLPIK